MDFYRGKIPIIKNSLDEGFIRGLPGAIPATGAIDRDFDIDPVAVGDSPDSIELIDPSNWDAAWEEQEAEQSSLEHILTRSGNPAFDVLDQNGFPDCWTHSTAIGMMMERLKANVMPLRFNGVAVATILKQTNGGWSGLSLKFAREHGFPVVGTGVGQWPYQSRKGKDTPELRASMKKHRVVEEIYDLGRREWDQVLSQKQLATLSFSVMAMMGDWMPYGHAMAIVRIVKTEAGRWLPLVFNSWKGWGWNGLGVVPIWPNNAVAIRATTPSVD